MLLLLSALAFLLAAPVAVAYPGGPIEPPIQNLAPGEFGSVPVSKGGVDVAYTCPSYAGGGESDYVVRFSNGNEKDAAGRLVASPQYFAGEAVALPALPGEPAVHICSFRQ